MVGPIFGPNFGPELWLPKDGLPKDWWGQMVGPALSSPLRFLVGEVGKGSGKRIVWWGKLVGRRGWRKWAGQRLGGRKVRGGRRRLRLPTPYAGPPPAQSSCGGAPRALGSGQRWGAPLAPPSPSRREEGGGLCLKEKRPWAHTAQSLMPSG